MLPVFRRLAQGRSSGKYVTVNADVHASSVRMLRIIDSGEPLVLRPRNAMLIRQFSKREVVAATMIKSTVVMVNMQAIANIE